MIEKYKRYVILKLTRGNPVSGFSAWYIYLQPVVSGGSGLGGHAVGTVLTTLTAR